MVTLEATPPKRQGSKWKVVYQFASEQNRAPRRAKVIEDDTVLAFEIPIEQPAPPGVKARLLVETRFWNDWHTSPGTV